MHFKRILAIAGCLPLLACYEEPVRDHLHIAFMSGPAVVVTAVRDVGHPDATGENPAVEDRVREAQSDLEDGWDRWSRGFAELEAIADRRTVERRDGQPRRAIRSALLESFRPVERLLGNEGLGAYFDDSGDSRELQLFPSGGGHATRQQRELFESNLGEWTETVADYLETAGELYAYLDRAPYRAVPCFAHIFDDDNASEPLTDHEEELVGDVMDGIEGVATALLIDTGNAHSLNELSRLVFDTFQGRLTIAVDGRVIEIEGFTDHGDYLERPPVDLWRALGDIARGWISPDLVTALVVPGPEEAQPEVDPETFADIPRSWGPAPDAWTVEGELRDRLQPEELYLVRWRNRPVPADDDELEAAAMRMLATAETDLPR